MNHAGFFHVIFGIAFITMGLALRDPKFEPTGLITGWIFGAISRIYIFQTGLSEFSIAYSDSV